MAKRTARPASKSIERSDTVFRDVIDLHNLPDLPQINGARLRELTGDSSFPADAQIIVRALSARVGDRQFNVGFCLGNEDGVSAIGIAVIERLAAETAGAPLHIVPVPHADIAWDVVLRHLRTFTGSSLLFTFPDSDTYDAGVAEIHSSRDVRQFDSEGNTMRRPTAAERREIRARKAAILGRPAPRFYSLDGCDREDPKWIFRVVTPAGKAVRVAVWNGRRDYAHELPEDILQWVGGDRIAIVQVSSPVGIDLRSSVKLTHVLASEYDGIVHWSRDTATFDSIWQSFVRLDFESVGRPVLDADWKPEIVIFGAND